MQNYEEIFESVESCEMIGDFQEEYVYDVEIDDPTHTFIANDMLVHNSLFVSFKPIIDHCDWQNLLFNKEWLEGVDTPFIILTKKDLEFNNSNHIKTVSNVDELTRNIKNLHNRNKSFQRTCRHLGHGE